jgi:hypothetical protein
MSYKEKIQDEIKKEELRDLWQKMYKAYEEGRVGQIELELNSFVIKLKESYKQALKKLEEIL